MEADEAGKTRTHSFQLIGLVPGKTNHVTLAMTGPAGNVTNTVTFDIAMPAPISGYPTQLDSVEGTSAQTASSGLYNGTASYVYRYLVDENAGTYELIASFAVPYSSIVSNVAHAPAGTNYVVNSGIDNTFGEYDESGELIREFSYTCTLQGYRVFKHDFAGFWFAG